MTAPSLMPKKDETLFEYWASFSPLAPWVGVDWRFAPMFRTPDAEAANKAARKSAKSVSQVTKEAAKIAADRAAKNADRAAKSAARTGETAAKVVETAAKTSVIASNAVADGALEAQESFQKVASDAAELMAKPAELFSTPPAKIDDLKLIRGVGPKLEREMNALGVYTFEQIAKFTQANLEWADANLSTIKGRPMRDDWVGQALDLMKKA